MIQFEISHSFQASSVELYNAWLDSDKHSAMTGGEAHCGDQESDSFTAWDGYISGVNLELIPNRKIVQHWRTIEFKETDAYSLLEIEFQTTNKGAVVLIKHANIPEGQPDYEKGWVDNYFEPMTEYFIPMRKE